MPREDSREDPKSRSPSISATQPLKCGGGHMHTHRTCGDPLDRHAWDTRQSSFCPIPLPQVSETITFVILLERIHGGTDAQPQSCQIRLRPLRCLSPFTSYIYFDVKISLIQSSKLSPSLKTLAIEHLLKSKYHATHLGVFNERQLTTIDEMINKASTPRCKEEVNPDNCNLFLS
jgi:hypothetical protein